MPHILIRPAAMSDVPSMVQLQSSAGPPAATPGAGAQAQQQYWCDAIAFGEPQLQVACDGDMVVGFVGYDRSRDRRTPPTMGEIWAIYVAPTYWDQGVGLALWDAAREGLLEEGCTSVSIWIELACERALRFHELAGFKRDMPSLRTVPKGTVRVEEIRLKRKL